VKRISRATALVIVAVAWGTWEIGWLGARPQVLSLVLTVFLAPVALELDAQRKENKKQPPGGDGL
jgi:hypothetical protein